MNPSSTRAKPSVLLVQPYIPAYREQLFVGLKQTLAEIGIQFTVAAALPRGTDAMRRDDRTRQVADYVLSERRLPFFGKSLKYRSLKSAMNKAAPTHIIAEQAVSNIETLVLLSKTSPRSVPRIGLWGQGSSYSASPSVGTTRLKRHVTMKADWFFAYTESSAQRIEKYGFPSNRVTVLNNSVDTAQLFRDLASVTSDARSAFMIENGLHEGKVALFLGGIDERKGIPFLLDAARRASELLPGFTLLIGGAGSMGHLVREEQANGAPVRYLGRLEGRKKALALSSSSLLMIPEWVGLVAVDSLAAGRPIITTNHPSHSPEFEYLVDGENSMIVDHDVEKYARSVLHLLLDSQRLGAMQMKARQGAEALSIDNMIERFKTGIRLWTST